MERAERDHAGGILSLRTLLDEHRGALEYDLMQVGERLRNVPSPTCDWRDVWVMVRYAQPGTAVFRALGDEQADWGITEQLQAMQVDYLAWLVWAKTKDGQAGRNAPKPVPRPGVEPSPSTRVGTSASIDEIIAMTT